MKNELLKVSLRNHAIYLPNMTWENEFRKTKASVSALVANAQKLGFTFSEKLLHSLNGVPAPRLLEILNLLKEVTGVKKNWTPLVRNWEIPTGETGHDHFATMFASLFGARGTKLTCGHIIPKNTFPLERYNGCPFCGKPFNFSTLENYGQGSKLKVLTLWTEKDIVAYQNDLLMSKTALDATQVDSLKLLLKHLGLPAGAEVKMKETLMLVINTLIANDQENTAAGLFKNPNDILRYLWYMHTGFLQIIEPKTIAKRVASNHEHLNRYLNKPNLAKQVSVSDLKLKYTRKECRRVAKWLNSLKMNTEQCCEVMHPKRGMWIRVIRALRLSEYSKRKGFGKLAELLDVFYNEAYTVWQGRINHYRLRNNADQTFTILKKRPGLFARSLFSNMLWFGADETLEHFEAIQDKIPARLLLTLNMYANYYFDKAATRSVRPLGSKSKRIPANQLLQLYDDKALKGMQAKIEDLCMRHMRNRFSKVENDHATIYIDPSLFTMPLSIGDRSDTVQDMSSALMGTKFPLHGKKVRLFMQWGHGMRAQHLDMDLSCMVAYSDKTEHCSYAQLSITGCRHSGDIREIPHMIGTAEYIEIDVDTLASKGAQYVSFTCNAYSNGSIVPDLVVGWMDSKYPMRISKKNGVAYDPSCVEHQVKVTQGLSKGLLFGVLDVQEREVIWLEMNFGGQVVQQLDMRNVKALLAKLDSKMNIGALLELKAEAQHLYRVDYADEADEVYDFKWATNAAAVTQLFVD